MSYQLRNILSKDTNYSVTLHNNRRGLHIHSATDCQRSELSNLTDNEIVQFGLERMTDTLNQFYEGFRREQDHVLYTFNEHISKPGDRWRLNSENTRHFDIKTPRGVDFYAQAKIEHGDISRLPRKGSSAARRAYIDPNDDFPKAVPVILSGSTLHRNITVYIDVKKGVFDKGKLVEMYDDPHASVYEVSQFIQFLDRKMS
ncbi:hypothetical protein K9M79_00635 [Candidatus Woesearchaeota archaeon]|nr:hypothetical protein [Candidatus Woesearchaeota archaeon]